jgi:hypothetical protein
MVALSDVNPGRDGYIRESQKTFAVSVSPRGYLVIKSLGRIGWIAVYRLRRLQIPSTITWLELDRL